MTLNNSMSITPMPPAKAKGARFEHGSVLGGKTRAARVNSQWKSTASTEEVSRQLDDGDVTAKPMPDPKETRTKENAAATIAPAKIGLQCRYVGRPTPASLITKVSSDPSVRICGAII